MMGKIPAFVAKYALLLLKRNFVTKYTLYFNAENQILLQNFLINFVTDARIMSDKI